MRKSIIVLTMLLLLTVVLGANNVFAATSTTSYSFTGAQQTWTVPAGVTLVTVEVWGAGGGSTGVGGYSKGDLIVTAGQTVYIYVGGQGSGRSGGWNGGGNGGATAQTGDGYGGSGATDVRYGGNGVSNRKIVAGGGGGNGAMGEAGGFGGGTNGGGGAGYQPGAGGTQTTGGANGIGAAGGDEVVMDVTAGGGGGGGYFGGDGGSNAGGGGGSGYIGGVTNAVTTAGNVSFPAPGGGNETGHSGNGVVRLTWVANIVPVISLTSPGTSQSVDTSGTITISGTVTDPDSAQTITISAAVNSIQKQATVAAPASSAAWSLSWSGSELGVGSYSADITVTASDGTASVTSTYTGDITVTLLLQKVPASTILDVEDLQNNDNASDVRVIFNGASDESKITSYRIIAAVGTINEATASGLASLSYVTEPPKGRGRMHLVYLPASLQSSTGGAVNAAGGSYNIYVLSVAKAGYGDKLSAPVSISLTTNNSGDKIQAATPISSDIANNGNGADLRVSFKRSKSEVNIQEYRVIVSTGDLTLNTALSVASAGYKQIIPTNPKVSYTVTMGSAQTDQGGATVIQNGTTYKIYILVIGKNGYANMLSTPSKPITLSQYVPGAYAVRAVSAVKVGTGHDSSNIKVTFYEPTMVNNIQEYRILIVPNSTNLTLSAAEGVVQASRYQSVAVSGRLSPHTVTLNTGVSAYDGTALAAGDYKVYVLTVGQTGYGNKLSAASGIVKLD